MRSKIIPFGKEHPTDKFWIGARHVVPLPGDVAIDNPIRMSGRGYRLAADRLGNFVQRFTQVAQLAFRTALGLVSGCVGLVTKLC